MGFDHKYISQKKWAIADEPVFRWRFLQNIHFIEPIGLVFLAGLIDKQFEFAGSGSITFNTEVIGYLERIHFLSYLEKSYRNRLEIIPQQPKQRHYPLADRLLEFQKIEFTDRYDCEECIERLAILCQGRIGNAVSFAYINDVFAELLSNVARHSKTLSFFTIAQKYPKNEVLKISIGDLGIGIPESIRGYTSRNLRDNDAIMMATLPDVSADGGGMGLTTLKSYLQDPEDYLFILSNSGCVKFTRNVNISYANFKSSLSGSFIEICFKMDSKYRSEMTVIDQLF